MVINTTYKNLLFQYCQKVGFPAFWLDAIIVKESGRNPAIKNGIGASGLIQFTKSTLKELNAPAPTTYSDNFNLIEKYLSVYINKFGKPKSPEILYSYIFYPSMNNGVFPKNGTSAYSLNKSLDKNNDGIIDFSDLRKHLESQLEVSKRELGYTEIIGNENKNHSKNSLFDISFVIIIIALIGFFAWKTTK